MNAKHIIQHVTSGLKLPQTIQQALLFAEKDFKEVKGVKSNPNIMAFAKKLGVESIYKNDDTPWCALCHGCLLVEAGFGNFVNILKGYDLIRAASYRKMAIPQTEVPGLGDTLIFQRDGGNHIGLYLCENKTAYFVIGGNQSNDYNVIAISKKRLTCAIRTGFNVQLNNDISKLVNSSVNEQ